MQPILDYQEPQIFIACRIFISVAEFAVLPQKWANIELAFVFFCGNCHLILKQMYFSS
jgi:hypothetical protein